MLSIKFLESMLFSLYASKCLMRAGIVSSCTYLEINENNSVNRTPIHTFGVTD